MSRFDSIVILVAKARGATLLASVPLRRLREKYPTRQIVCVTQFPELVVGLPYVDKVLFYETPGIYEQAIKDCEIIDLTGTLDFQPHRRDVPRHLISLLCERAGVTEVPDHPECNLTEEETATASRLILAARQRPELSLGIFTSTTSTPNKEWSAQHWTHLISRTAHYVEWIHLGRKKRGLDGTICLDVEPRQMIGILGMADCIVTLDTFMLHAAATQFRDQRVILLLGSTKPECVSYPEFNNIFHLQLDCQPCGRPHHPLDIAYSSDGVALRWPSGRERGWECSHVECMDLITAMEVERAVANALSI